MDIKRKVFQNTALQYTSRFGIILLSLVTTSILTRFLGASGYGRFGIISTLVIFFVTLADWGTQAISVREASRAKHDTSSIFASAAALRTAIALIATSVYIVVVAVYPNFSPFRISAWLASPIILLLSLKTSALIIHQVRLNLFFPSLAEFLNSFTFFLLLLFLAKTSQLSLSTVILSLIAGSLVNVSLSLIPVYKQLLILSPKAKTISYLLIQSLPMGAYLALFSVYNRIDTFILQRFHGDIAVGMYILPFKVHENFILGAAYFMNAVYPLISRDPKTARILFQKIFAFLVPVSFLVAVIGFFLASPIINTLGGPDFTPSVNVMRILFFATAISYLNHLTGYTLIAIGKQWHSLKFAVFALFLNLSLNLLFIPKYSYTASAVITVVTEAFMLSVTLLFLIKNQSFFSPVPKP